LIVGRAVAVGKNRSPKLLLLGVAAVVALLALAYVFVFSATKTISVAPARVETGGASSGDSVVNSVRVCSGASQDSCRAKVMGRVAWIGVEKGDTVQQGQVLVRLKTANFALR